ncbi:hypothetical protein D9M68_641950 [compost metagenome]
MLTSAMPYRVTLVSAEAVPAARPRPARARDKVMRFMRAPPGVAVLVAPGLWPGLLRMAGCQAVGGRSDASDERGSGRQPRLHMRAMPIGRMGAWGF